MARFISRHIRIATMIAAALCVILCAGLAASATNHVIEGKYLGDSPEPQLPVVTPVARPRPKVATRPTKNGDQLIERNMFCAECAPEQEVAAPTTESGIPLTSLPIELVATSLAGNAEASFATIRNTQSSHQGAFFTADTIPGAGPIERISGTYVVFQNSETNRVEKVSLLSAGKTTTPITTTGRTSKAASGYEDRVKKIDEHTYEVEREIVQQFITDPTKLKIRPIPVQKDGKIVGIRLLGVRRNSPLLAIGLKNGDTVQTINGYDLSSPDKMLEAYAKVKDADNVTIGIQRRGKSVDMKYHLR